MHNRPEGKPKSRLQLIREGFANVENTTVSENQAAIDTSRTVIFFDGERQFNTTDYNYNAEKESKISETVIKNIKDLVIKKIKEKFPNVDEKIRDYILRRANQNGFAQNAATKTFEYFSQRGLLNVSIRGEKRLDLITNTDNTITVVEHFNVDSYDTTADCYKHIAHVNTKSVISLDENGKICHSLISDRIFLLDEKQGTKLFAGQPYETRNGCSLDEVKDECQELINLRVAKSELSKAIKITTNEFMKVPAQNVLSRLSEINKKEHSKAEISKLTSFVKSTTNLLNTFNLDNLREFTKKTDAIVSINKPWAKKVGYAALGVLGVALVAASVTFAIYSAGIGPLVVAGVVIGVKTLFAASVATAALSAVYSADGFYNMWKKQSKPVEAAKELNKVASKQLR